MADTTQEKAMAWLKGANLYEFSTVRLLAAYAAHVTAAQQAELDKRFAHLPDDYDDNELREQLRTQQAEIERLKEGLRGLLAESNLTNRARTRAERLLGESHD